MRAFTILALLMALVGAPLAAEIEPGAKAPDFKFNKSWNTPAGASKLSDLRGKFVYVVHFATYSTLSMDRMADIEKLNGKYQNEGLEIVAASGEPHAEIQRVMIDAKQFTFGIANANIAKVYEHENMPHGWIIDPKGIVLWRGNPMELKEDKLQGWLNVYPPEKIDRKLANELAEAARLFNKGDVGMAMAEAERVSKAATSEEVKKDCEYVMKFGNRHIKAFETRLKEAGKNLVEKVKIMQAGGACLRGWKIGDDWAREALQIKESKDYEAFIELDNLKKTLEELKPFAARKKLEALAKKYPDTEAGKEAAEMAKKYE